MLLPEKAIGVKYIYKDGENTTHKEKGRGGGGKKRDKSIESSLKFTGVAARLAKYEMKLISI